MRCQHAQTARYKLLTGTRAFVACSDGNIVVVDLKTLEVTGRFEVGGVPDGLEWAIRPN